MLARYYLLIIYIIACNQSFGQEEAVYDLSFIQNNGQIADFDNQLRPDVLFSSNVNGMNLFLRNTGVSYLLGNVEEVEKLLEKKVNKFKESNDDELEAEQYELKLREKMEFSFHQIDVDFLNCNKGIKVKTKKRTSDYINYYNVTNPNGITKVPLFNLIEYQNVYDGIDIDFYGKGNGFEYDFKVSRNSDPSQIKLLWKGSEGMEILEDGRLKIGTSLNEIYESIPEAYQMINGEKSLVQVKYVLTDIPNSEHTIISFEIATYDSTKALIIDPWITYYGGASYEITTDLCNDSSGNLYVVGNTGSINSISTPGSFQPTLTNSIVGTSNDGFIVKFSPNGSRIWATYFGGNKFDYIHAICVDKNDFVYISGFTNSDTGIATTSSYKDTLTNFLASPNGQDAFLAKFSPSGNRLWSTYYGGESYEEARDVAADEVGNVYITGSTRSFTGISTTGAFKTTLSSGSSGHDAYLAKFSSLGNLLWGTYYGGSQLDHGWGLAVDDSNNVFFSGMTGSATGISTVGTYKTVITAVSGEAFLAKFRSNGTRAWGTYFGGGWCVGFSVAVDTNSDVYMTGNTSNPSGVGSIGSFQPTFGGVRDAFLAKFDQTGNRLWSTNFGGARAELGHGITVNEQTNNVLISGETRSTNLPTTPCSIQTSLIGGQANGFFAQFYPDGKIYCSSYFGPYYESFCKVSTYGCYIYLAEQTRPNILFGGNFSTPGAHQTAFGGAGSDGLIAQLYLNSCDIIPPAKSFSTSKVDNSQVCTPCNGSASVLLNRPSCNNDSLFTYTWSDGTVVTNTMDTFNTLSNLCSGNYWVEISINNSCYISRDTVFFNIIDTNLVSVDFTHDSVCFGYSTSFVNTTTNEPAGTIHYWSFGDGSISSISNPTKVYGASGTYIVTYIQQYGSSCFDTISKTITVHPKPQAILSVALDGNEYFSDNMDSLCTYLYEIVEFKDYSTVSGLGIINDFIWIFGTENSSTNQDPSYAFQGIKKYPVSLIVTTDKGCKDTTQTIIKVCDDFNFNMPNSFTPNGDGINDVFMHSGFGIDTEKYLFQIFNRWGELVYETTKLEGWDGTHNGIDVPEEVYVWKLRYKKLAENKVVEKIGHVTVLRKRK